MPFGAVCIRCKHFMINEKLFQIAKDITSHLKESHNAFPSPPPSSLDMSDFVPHNVELMHSNGRFFTFMSRLYHSEDYNVAVITWANYNSWRYYPLKDEDFAKKHLSNLLSDYFPDLSVGEAEKT